VEFVLMRLQTRNIVSFLSCEGVAAQFSKRRYGICLL
jgi:hypothetical protein